jgi:hypothetical protein
MKCRITPQRAPQTSNPGCSPYATARLPGCQTPRRDEKDDHVYETIPGDDLLQYEEILRMRLNGMLPTWNSFVDMIIFFVPSGSLTTG